MGNISKYGEMMKVDVVYERGVFKIINPAKIDTDEITVHIVNRDEILTETDMLDILDAVSSRKEDSYHTYEETFE
jgi:predicted DNA-binding antitoxin AbrB/MazE fold protein